MERTPPLERFFGPALLLLVIALFGAAVGFVPIRSFDYWWHLATGEWIVAHGEVPRVDAYTYTVPGARWIDLHWLFQVGLHGLHQLGGHEAVRLAKGGLVWLVLGGAAAIGFRRGAAGVTGVAVALLAAIGSSRFLERPDLLSFVLLLALLALLFRHERSGGWGVLAVVPLQLVWANVHGLFAVGLAVLGMAFLAELLRPWMVPGERHRRARWLPLVVAGALSGAVSFANPNGLEGVLFPLEQLGMIGGWQDRGVFGRVILELRPSLELGVAALAPVWALIALLLLGWALRGREVSAFDLLLGLAFLYLAFSARRNLALFAVVAVPLVNRSLGAAVATRVPARLRRYANAGVLALLVLLGGVFAARSLEGAWGSEGRSAPALFPLQYPEAAVDWIERERPPGPIYHRMGDGGYLIARLFPAYRVLVDGRLEVFGAERFADFEVEDGGRPENFRRLERRYRFGTALLHHALLPDTSLLSELHRDPDWRMVWLDDVAAVFVREPAGADWEAADPASLSRLPEAGRADLDLWRRRVRIGLLSALGEPRQALALADESLALHPDARIEGLRDQLRRQTPLGAQGL